VYRPVTRGGEGFKWFRYELLLDKLQTIQVNYMHVMQSIISGIAPMHESTGILNIASYTCTNEVM